MDRAELERLDRDSLIAHAEAAGVARARILTRPELVDELLIRSEADQTTKQRSRGLFGRARDLLARVVERGLHLPDAAERIRAVGGLAPNRPSAPAALPTVTLAEIYTAQGYRDRAIETLERLLAREPDHAPARTLLAQLQDEAYALSPPRMPPEEEEDLGTPEEDAEEPAKTLVEAPAPREVDECVAIPVDPATLYVSWGASKRTLEHLRAARSAGTMAVRALVIVPTWEGPRSSVRDHEVSAGVGEILLRDLPVPSVVRVAIGYRHEDTFLPIAHSPALETAASAAAPSATDVLLRWTPDGTLRVSPDDPDAASIDRAAARARSEMNAEPLES